jgi:hypothetical protein
MFLAEKRQVVLPDISSGYKFAIWGSLVALGVDMALAKAGRVFGSQGAAAADDAYSELCHNFSVTN